MNLDRSPPAIREPDLQRLHTYWDTKRGTAFAPTRADIDITDLTWVLGRLMLIDTADTLAAFRVRLFGTVIAEEFGQDRTGLRFDEIVNVENLDAVLARYWTVYSTGRPDYQQDRTVSDLRSFRCYSRLLLPLSDDGERTSMILAGVTFFGSKEP